MLDYQQVFSWLQRADVGEWNIEIHPQSPRSLAKPYATPPASDKTRYTSKRTLITLNEGMEVPEVRSGSPSKRQRANPPTQSVGSAEVLGQSGFFPQPVPSELSSQSRPSSPKRDLINELRCAKPSINCQPLKGKDMPDTVAALVGDLTKDFGSRFIPLGLKVS